MTPHHNIQAPIAALIALFSVTACAPSSGGQVGEEKVLCDAVASQPLGLGEASPLGFSAMDVLDNLGTEVALNASWNDETDADATLSVAYQNGTIEFQDREWVDASTGQVTPLELGTFDCLDVIVLGVTLDLVTDDGRLDESIELSLDVTDPDTIELFQELETIAGSLEPMSMAPPGEWTGVRTILELTWTNGAPVGVLFGQLSSGVDGGVAVSEQYTMATFAP